MIIVSVKNAERLHDHAIIQPRDESCWIVKDPTGRHSWQFPTRKLARSFVSNRFKNNARNDKI